MNELRRYHSNPLRQCHCSQTIKQPFEAGLLPKITLGEFLLSATLCPIAIDIPSAHVSFNHHVLVIYEFNVRRSRGPQCMYESNVDRMRDVTRYVLSSWDDYRRKCSAGSCD